MYYLPEITTAVASVILEGLNTSLFDGKARWLIIDPNCWLKHNHEEPLDCFCYCYGQNTNRYGSVWNRESVVLAFNRSYYDAVFNADLIDMEAKARNAKEPKCEYDIVANLNDFDNYHAIHASKRICEAYVGVIKNIEDKNRFEHVCGDIALDLSPEINGHLFTIYFRAKNCVFRAGFVCNDEEYCKIASDGRRLRGLRNRHYNTCFDYIVRANSLNSVNDNLTFIKAYNDISALLKNKITLRLGGNIIDNSGNEGLDFFAI